MYRKALFTHLQKAVNSIEAPPKPKHVRAIILETHNLKNADFLYPVTHELEVLTNQICCWKYLIVIHKTMRCGHRKSITYSTSKIAVLEDIKRCWDVSRTSYGPMIVQLCNVILKKLVFHRNFAFVPGDFEVSQKEISESFGQTHNTQLMFCVALLDYLETLLNFQSSVFSSVSRGLSLSQLADNCKLAALTQCVQDCAAIYDLSLKSLIRLHSIMSPGMLEEQRDRFCVIYFNLEQFFIQANKYQYIRHLLKIPILSNKPPNFLDTSGGIETIKVTETPQEAQLIELNFSEATSFDKEENANEEFEVLFGGTAGCPDNKDSVAVLQTPSVAVESTTPSEYVFEIEMLKSEFRRKQNENATSQGHLLDRIRSLEEEIKALVQVKSRQDEQLLLLVEEVKNKTAVSTTADEKYTKIREAYAKLREDHVSTLKQLGSLQVQRNQMQTALEPTDSSKADLQKRLTELEAEKASCQVTCRSLETDLAEARVALQAAEDKTSRLSILINEARVGALKESHHRLLMTACAKAIEDSRDTNALLVSQEFIHCRSYSELANSFARKTLAVAEGLKEALSSPEDNEALSLDIARISDYLNATVFHAKAVSNVLASIERSDELGSVCRSCLNNGFEIYSNLSSGILDQYQKSVVSKHVNSLILDLGRIAALLEEGVPSFKDVNDKDLEALLETEMQHTADLIAAAETRFKELLEKSKSLMTGIQLSVHEEILDSCTALMSAIAELVVRARDLQTEIVNENRGTATVKEFYKRHNRWTSGLFSASKSVAAGANLLVETADSIVTDGSGKLEQLIVAALEISSSTTQLLVASRVKAIPTSTNLANLETAAKTVSQTTGKVVAGVNNASSINEQSDDMDFSNLTFTQARKAEVDSQVRVLELEAQLTAERKRLAEIRRVNYASSAELEQKS